MEALKATGKLLFARAVGLAGAGRVGNRENARELEGVRAAGVVVVKVRIKAVREDMEKGVRRGAYKANETEIENASVI